MGIQMWKLYVLAFERAGFFADRIVFTYHSTTSSEKHFALLCNAHSSIILNLVKLALIWNKVFQALS